MNKNYDIGILTFWGVPNYGTFAQAYALQRVVENLSSKRSVKQIAHLDERHYNFYYNKSANYKLWNMAYWKEKLRNIIDKEDVIKRKNTFLQAYDTIPHTNNINFKNVDKVEFETVFLGSDIIWDFTIDVFNRDTMLFGDRIKSKNINAYAASFGTVKKDTTLPVYVIECIKKMKSVSVRDENSADIVESITGKRPVVVLDPVWLWDFEKDENIEVPEYEDYILVYGQDFTDEFIMNLIDYANKEKKKIIALDCNDDSYSWCDIMVKQQELSPYKWIGYFKKASIVATSTFHGLTFGLVFKKRIAFCKTEFIMDKVDIFLKNIYLFELFDDRNDVEKMINYSWDYKMIYSQIERARKVSIDFLEGACKKRKDE